MPRGCSKIGKVKYPVLQGRIDKRIQWAKCAEDVISAHFEQWGNCAESYKRTFIAKKSFFSLEASQGFVDKGSYGNVYKVYIKNAPNYPVAVKRSNEQEIDEARRMVLTTALVEAKVNPHFPMLFAHFHCEEKSSRERGDKITYRQSLKLIGVLEDKLERLKVKSQSQGLSHAEQLEYESEIPKKIDEIVRVRVPTIEEIMWATKIKSKLTQRYRTVVETPSLLRVDGDESQEVRVAAQEKEALTNATLLLQDMLKKRQEDADAKPYELFAMEYLEGTLWEWLSHGRSEAQLFSCAFQVCAAFVSMLSYFGMIQNDLNFKNIMYNTVPMTNVYCYKMGERADRYLVKHEGFLFKVIDFGLSTNINRTSEVYCVGVGIFGSCTGYSRDFIEFFYRLEAIWGLPTRFRNWVTESKNLFLNNQPTSLRDLVTLLRQIFNRIPTIRRTRSCPSNATSSFNLLANKARRQKVMNLALEKHWLENVRDIAHH